MYRLYAGSQGDELDEEEQQELAAIQQVVLPADILAAIHRIAPPEVVEAVIERFQDVLYFQDAEKAGSGKTVVPHFVYLRNLRLRDPDILGYVLPFIVNHAPRVVELDVSSNQIGDEGLAAIVSCKQIKILNISSNRITDKGFDVLASNQTLKHIDVDFNQISGQALEKLTTNESLTSFSCSIFLSDTAPVHRSAFASAKSAEKSIQKHRAKLAVDRKVALSMGGHPRLGKDAPILHSFFRHKMLEPRLLNEIFSYIKPEQIEDKSGPSNTTTVQVIR